jgi:hypothetical protein
MKTRPVGAELFHVDGRTDKEADRQTEKKDITKLIIVSRNFGYGPIYQLTHNVE